MTDIISPLPFDMSNGTTADASQVMADLNQIRNDINSQIQVGGPGITIPGYNGAKVSIAISTDLNDDGSISFDTVVIDTASIFSISSPTKLTVPSGVSKVRLFAQIAALSLPSTGIAALSMYKNGASGRKIARIDRNLIFIAGADRIIDTLQTTVQLCSPGDYFQVFLGTSASNSGITIQSADTLSSFEMQIIG